MLLPAAWDTAERTAEFKRRSDDSDLDKKGERARSWPPRHSSGCVRTLTGPNDLPVILREPSRAARKDVDAVLARMVLPREGRRRHRRRRRGRARTPERQAARRLRRPDCAREDRLDPSVVAPGAAWDWLLQQGQDAWGALAGSDFHAESNGDYWPCQFWHTVNDAPDRGRRACCVRSARAASSVCTAASFYSAELRVMTTGARGAGAGRPNRFRVDGRSGALSRFRHGHPRDRLVGRRESHRRD